MAAVVTIDAEAERPPADAGEPSPHHRFGPHVALYPYHDAEGLMGYVARYETDDGKQFSPWRWIAGKWQARSLPKPRPLFGTERLLERPEADALVLADEEAATAAAALLPRYVAVSWHGAADSTDWSLLDGRRVILWPSNDPEGRKTMAELGGKLLAKAKDLRIINPEGQSAAWSVTQAVAEGWDSKRAVAWIKRDGGKFLVTITASSPVPDNTAPPSSGSPTLVRPSELGPASGQDLNAFKDLANRQLWEMHGLDTRINESGVPPSNEDTVTRIIGTKIDQFWHDDFLKQSLTTWGTGQPHEVQDGDIADVLVWMQRSIRLHRMSFAAVKRGLELCMYRNKRNCAQEWLTGLVWDGTPRLDFLMPLGFGAVDNEYHRKVGRNFIMGMVHRIMEPGCKVDNLPILEGPQGKFKSTALSIIGGEWFTESHESFESKDWCQILNGKMLIEFPELHKMMRSTPDLVKGKLSNRVDRYRASYGRTAGDYPRMCVFSGTTNRDDWNVDDTGARRFWRVLTGTIDLDWIAEWRLQYFAEAVEYVKQKQEHYRVPDDEAKQLQYDAMSDDPWHRPVMGYAERMQPVRPEDVLRDALQIPLDRQDKPALARVRSILRREGWVSAKFRRGNDTFRAWRPPSVADDMRTPAPEIELPEGPTVYDETA